MNFILYAGLSERNSTRGLHKVGSGEKWHIECAYAYFWEEAPGIGAKTINHLYEKYKSYEAMYQSLCSGSIYADLRMNGELSEARKNKKTKLNQHANTWKVVNEYERMLHNHIFCLPINLSGYPQCLKEINQAPSALFVKGKLPDQSIPHVAIIGARNCSNYGSVMAKLLGEAMADYGIGVISGLARGIDGISQLAAVNRGGATFGILGSGVDMCYPEENYALYERLAKGENKSGVISEFCPGIKAESNHFPMRNRIISGLADAIVVVEAKEKSGTFITVERALEQGKNVYVVPGRTTDRLSYGCNRLISQGAGVVWDIGEFAKEVLRNKQYQVCGRAEYMRDGGISANGHGASGHGANGHGARDEGLYLPEISDFQREIVEALDLEYISIEEVLCKLVSADVSNVLYELEQLVNLGFVEGVNGYYRLAVKLES